MANQKVLLIESACKIHVDTGRVTITRLHDNLVRTELASDLALLCLHHEQITITHHALRILAQSHCHVMVTDLQHMPCAMLQPLSENASSVAVNRLRAQIASDSCLELKNALWQSLIKQKIANSAYVLHLLTKKPNARLNRLSQETLPGDASNVEGHAARLYWKEYFSLPTFQNASEGRHKKGATDGINVRLNYGYAIVRAMIAREIAIAGLNPILGIGHFNQFNAFNLVDDLIEPYRFIVELAVTKFADYKQEFIGSEKLALIEKLQCIVNLTYEKDKRFRFSQAVALTVKSYCMAIESQNAPPKLKLPTALFYESEFD